jgi:hypothetical protein
MPKLLILSGGPGIAYISSDNNDLYFMASLDQDGASWPASANLAAEESGDYSLALVQSRPAAVFRKLAVVGGPICFVQSGSFDGNAWGGELTLDDSSAFSTPDLMVNVQTP